VAGIVRRRRDLEQRAGPVGERRTTYSFTATTGESDDEYQAVFTNALGSATSVPAGLAVAPFALPG
jgi:S-adenosylmethionine:tRNA-ribosyltransferase-isomerase (queuine synthetase)